LKSLAQVVLKVRSIVYQNIDISVGDMCQPSSSEAGRRHLRSAFC